MPVHIVEHPVIALKLSHLRNKDISARSFRSLVSDIATILAVHATTDLPVHQSQIVAHSPIASYNPIVLSSNIGLFPILRAGIGMTDAMLNVLPEAVVHHIGIYREKSTFLPVEYYNKLPTNCQVDIGFVLDPMIATAGTAIAAVNILKDWGLKNIKFLAILTSASGLHALKTAHPDISIYVAAVDEELTAKKYIVPGFGDVGDRLFSTHH